MAFINAPLEEVIFVRQVRGFERPGKARSLLKLRKALYGTKQAANAWQKFLKKILLDAGARIHPCDECVYIFYTSQKSFCFISTHVDDLFVLYSKEGETIRDHVYKELEKHVKIDNRGSLKWALSTKIQRDAKAGVIKI